MVLLLVLSVLAALLPVSHPDLEVDSVFAESFAPPSPVSSHFGADGLFGGGHDPPRKLNMLP